ncbi:formyltetrahydrofolate hydrolase [Sinorhizobium fredii]|nr:Formyltetrahydrofolate deformylase [Sinorhizobium fredii CCBAU 25509]
MDKFILTVSCPSTRGIVAALSGYLAEQGCNIIDSSQFDDLQTGLFFMRISFISEQGVGRAALQEGLKPIAAKFAMETALHDQAERTKVLLMVSRFGHCLNCRSTSSASSPTTSTTRRWSSTMTSRSTASR